jgi:hypothetical protein
MKENQKKSESYGRQVADLLRPLTLPLLHKLSQGEHLPVPGRTASVTGREGCDDRRLVQNFLSRNVKGGISANAIDVLSGINRPCGPLHLLVVK